VRHVLVLHPQAILHHVLPRMLTHLPCCHVSVQHSRPIRHHVAGSLIVDHDRLHEFDVRGDELLLDLMFAVQILGRRQETCPCQRLVCCEVLLPAPILHEAHSHPRSMLRLPVWHVDVTHRRAIRHLVHHVCISHPRAIFHHVLSWMLLHLVGWHICIKHNGAVGHLVALSSLVPSADDCVQSKPICFSCLYEFRWNLVGMLSSSDCNCENETENQRSRAAAGHHL